MSEVDFWVQEVANPEGESHWDYEARLNNEDFFGLTVPYRKDRLSFVSSIPSLKKYLKNKMIVMDIGCGLAPLYGSRLPDSQRVHLITIDPLAPFYNKINQKYSNGRQVSHRFGMFEFLANFFDENYSDIIIINNALDHCIDPYKSIVECSCVLKPGGKMFLVHRRAEALYEGYSGLHKWNLDYRGNDFIIWNKSNALNISQKLRDILQIEVMHSPSPTPREEQIVIVEMTKKRSFALADYIDSNKEGKQLASVIEKLMSWSVDRNLDFLNFVKG